MQQSEFFCLFVILCVDHSLSQFVDTESSLRAAGKSNRDDDFHVILFIYTHIVLMASTFYERRMFARLANY